DHNTLDRKSPASRWTAAIKRTRTNHEKKKQTRRNFLSRPLSLPRPPSAGSPAAGHPVATGENVRADFRADSIPPPFMERKLISRTWICLHLSRGCDYWPVRLSILRFTPTRP